MTVQSTHSIKNASCAIYRPKLLISTTVVVNFFFIVAVTNKNLNKRCFKKDTHIYSSISIFLNFVKKIITKKKLGTWSAYVGPATTLRILISAIPLLLDACSLSCWL